MSVSYTHLEWADMILFVNYKTFSVATDDKGTKHKAQGGTRTMYTTHHPCWDAKNRHNLPDEMPFEYERIAHCFKAVSYTHLVMAEVLSLVHLLPLTKV